MKSFLTKLEPEISVTIFMLFTLQICFVRWKNLDF